MARKIPDDMKSGVIHNTKFNGDLKVLSYNGCLSVDVEFLQTGYKTNTRSSVIRKGDAKDPLYPRVVGVGFFGVGIHKATRNGSPTKIYRTWKNMLQRCYGDNDNKDKSYADCDVCDEWHNFQNFAEWMSNQDHENKQLDKDIIIKGNKTYSPSTCSFVTSFENNAEAHAKIFRFISPSGELFEIYNLESFCRENDISSKNMSAVHCGRRSHHKGWKKANST